MIYAAGDLMAVILVPTAFIQICSKWKNIYIYIYIYDDEHTEMRFVK